MSKIYNFEDHEDVYLVILKYYKGDPLLLNKENIKELSTGKFNGETINPIDIEILKELKKIFKSLKKYTFTYPKWSKTQIKEKLDKMFPEIKDKPPSSHKTISKKEDYKYILEQRKSYVDWINNEYYDKIITESDDPIIKNNYQLFVKGYLSLESPFRGLLVYHGLGTGKTATSVITAEGLSTMKINTFLPASLEGNYIGEIKTFATDTFNIDRNNWVFYPMSEINKDDHIRNYLFNDIGIDNDFIEQIHRKVTLILKRKGIKQEKKKVNTIDDYSVDMDVSFVAKIKGTLTKMQGKVIDILKEENKIRVKIEGTEKEKNISPKSLKIVGEVSEEIPELIKNGLFINLNILGDTDKTIYTTDGKLVLNKYVKQRSSDNVERLSDIQKLQLETQLDFMIKHKYNFIHYNPYPSITKDQIEKLDIAADEKLYEQILDEETKKTGTSLIIDKLITKLNINKKKNIDSPFNNEVIIFDEVHNFISQIKNDKGPAKLFYNWIINSKDVKIVFLSGTPIINRPSEAAYLFNMLKGRIDVYDFSLKVYGDIDEISKKLKEIFYDKISSVEQLYVRKRKGKIVVSFIKMRSNFTNILDKDDGNVKTIKHSDYTFDDFIKQIYIGLHKFCDKSLITPSEKEFNKLSDDKKNSIINGSEHIFDTELDLIFNKKHKLFELYDDDNNIIDLSDNGVFMEYFFDEDGNIPPRKQVLLRRMLMGLTSYYPIDRSSISFMPEIVEPTIHYPEYDDYNITKKINIVPCYLSAEQFSRYEEQYSKEQKSSINRGNMYEDSTFHFFTGTRKSCNIVYNQDNKKGADLDKLYEAMNNDNNFGENLSNFSPKMSSILQNMEKFMNKSTGLPTGKVLVYSDYKSDGGTGAFEQVLIAQGYERYDPDTNNIDDLIKKNDRKKRYTFITGDAKQDKETNKNAFNKEENKYGEFIQVMMISKSGAEGITLTCVRQVHIIEPYWNNVRIDQVFGRAVRRNSHIQLDEKDRNVEQYLYLALFPEGNNIRDIFSSIKSLGWSITSDINLQDDFDKYLYDNHRSVYTLVQKVLHLKNMSQNTTSDQLVFTIMEKKFNITEKLNNIIKESSVDCLKHTTDDPILNNKCIQFSNKLQNELAYFPGIDSDELNKIDVVQLKSKKSFFIEPDGPIVVAGKNPSTENIFSYYKINPKYKDEDLRYIKENGTILCDFFLDDNKFFMYEPSKFSLNDKITNKFSVVQSIYHVESDDKIFTDYIEKDKFPRLELIRKKGQQYLVGYKIKYNINDKLFFMPKNVHNLNIYKLYDYMEYYNRGYSINELSYFVLYNNKFYKSI
jgi:hypothetical protein